MLIAYKDIDDINRPITVVVAGPTYEDLCEQSDNLDKTYCTDAEIATFHDLMTKFTDFDNPIYYFVHLTEHQQDDFIKRNNLVIESKIRAVEKHNLMMSGSLEDQYYRDGDKTLADIMGVDVSELNEKKASPIIKNPNERRTDTGIDSETENEIEDSEIGIFDVRHDGKGKTTVVGKKLNENELDPYRRGGPKKIKSKWSEIIKNIGEQQGGDPYVDNLIRRYVDMEVMGFDYEHIKSILTESSDAEPDNVDEFNKLVNDEIKNYPPRFRHKESKRLSKEWTLPTRPIDDVPEVSRIGLLPKELSDTITALRGYHHPDITAYAITPDMVIDGRNVAIPTTNIEILDVVNLIKLSDVSLLGNSSVVYRKSNPFIESWLVVKSNDIFLIRW
ncbi:MAG: hypothetical protein WC284_15955 [Candidimonas sp.]